MLLMWLGCQIKILTMYAVAKSLGNRIVFEKKSKMWQVVVKFQGYLMLFGNGVEYHRNMSRIPSFRMPIAIEESLDRHIGRAIRFRASKIEWRHCWQSKGNDERRIRWERRSKRSLLDRRFEYCVRFPCVVPISKILKLKKNY